MRKFLTEVESKLAVAKQCTAKNYTLISYLGEWNKGRTYIELLCNTCGNKWDTTCVRTFLKGHGCPECARIYTTKLKTLPDSHHIEIFNNVNNSESVYSYSRISMDEWEYTCSKCSNDEYVVAGLCSGIFKSITPNLRAGKFSCRCTKTYRWTKEQREFQINKLIAGTHLKFIGWESDRYKNNARIILNCSVQGHGEWRPMLSKFLYGNRCPDCSISGFKMDLEGCLYVIRAVSDNDEFTGFGITNCLKQRLSTHKKNFKNAGYAIAEMEVFYDIGTTIKNIETLIKMSFELTPREIEGFKTEATHYYLFDDIVNFVEEKLKEYNEKLQNKNSM